MREFFGLIVFIVLICIWSLVFVDNDIKDNRLMQKDSIVTEQSIAQN